MTDAPERRGGRGRAVLALAVAAAVTAGVSVPVWLGATGTTALRGAVPVDIDGSQVAPGVLAAAVVLLAAAAGVGIVGRVGRWVAVGAVVAAGLVVVASVVVVLRDPTAAATAAVAAETGVGVLTGDVRVTAWPWVALAVGALDVLGGVALGVASSAWAAPSARHVPVGVADTAAAVDDDRSAWDALTRGDDPTDR